MMQTHPIDLVREQLALVAFRFGQGLIGLVTALSLVGLMWVSSLQPADAAGPGLGPEFSASARAEGHLGVAALRLDGMGEAQTGVLAASTGVCRLVFDLDSEAPMNASCAPVALDLQVLTER